MGRYVTTTYRPHKLHVCLLGGSKVVMQNLRNDCHINRGSFK